MDFGFSEREEMLRKSVREFAEAEVTPKMEAMEETGEFPTDLLKPMADLYWRSWAEFALPCPWRCKSIIWDVR